MYLHLYVINLIKDSFMRENTPSVSLLSIIVHVLWLFHLFLEPENHFTN